MRVMGVAAAVSLSLVGLSVAQNAAASIKRPVSIQPQGLETALKTFSQASGLHIVYLSEDVSSRRTPGAAGELTQDEVLSRILGGTGLTYRYLDDTTVSVIPARTQSGSLAPAPGTPNEAQPETTVQNQPSSNSSILAQAQDREPTTPFTLEEVVVTAQKREERLQDVPMSLSVVTGDQLVSRQTNTLQGIVNSIPGVQLISSSPVNNEIVIRGLSVGSAINSSVATYVDEVPYTQEGPFAGGAINSPNFDTYDLARVELLRGPQGTLYGANALGGLLKYVTNAPDPTRFSSSFLLGGSTVAHGGNGYELHSMVNLPLSDTAALRLVGYDTHFPGFIDDPSRGVEDINDVKRYGGRATFLWKPSQEFNVRLSAAYQHLSAGDTGSEDLVASTLQPVYGDLIQQRELAQPQTVTNEVYNATLTWDPGFASIVSSTSYTKVNPVSQFDDSAAFGPILSSIFGGNLGAVIPVAEPVHSLTQELRISSPSTQTLEWTVGGFYTDEAAHEVEPLYVVDLDSHTTLPDFQPALGTYFIDSTYREYAGFADANYHVTSAFEIGLGGRYSSNEQSYHQVNDGVFTGTNDFTTHSKQSVFTYSVDAKYRFDPSLMTYLRVASGFVPGGPNDAVPGSPLPLTFTSSSTTNYEVGVKGGALEGRLTYDADVFDVQWKDIQLFAVFGNLEGITNGGTARSRGAEGSLSFVPVKGWTLMLNGAYTDARLTQDTPASFGGHSGDRLPLAPCFAGTVGTDYERPLWNGISGFGGIEWHYNGSRMSEFELGSPRQVLPSYSMVDLRAGAKFRSYTFTAYVQNAGDVRAISSVAQETLGSVQALTAAVAPPRTIGVTLSATF